MASTDTDSTELRTLQAVIRELGTLRELEANEIVFETGALEESMYLVEQGAVLLVFEDDWREVALESGEIFGELSLMLPGHRRTATAIAREQTRLRCIDRLAFERLRDESPRLLVDLLLHTSAYLLGSEFRLVQQLRTRQSELERALDYLQRTKEELSIREIESLTDPLTGIYNRRCFEDHLQRYAAGGRDPQGDLGLIVVDLDHFKQINDHYGHAAGDLVLKKVATAVKDSLRHQDLPCRIGGDEFAALIHGVDDDICRDIGGRILHSIRELDFGRRLNGLRASASLGGGRVRPGETGETFFERVDREQLYAAKAAGRNTLVWEGRHLC